MLTLPYGGGGNTRAYARGFERAGGLPRLHPGRVGERADTVGSAIRIVEPVHRAEVAEALERSGGSVVTVSDAELLEAWQLLRVRGGRLLGARVRGGHRRASPAGRRGGRAGRLRRHRPRAQGPGGDRPMSIHVRAPATTANIGAGFDVAGAALTLWNELVVTDGAERGRRVAPRRTRVLDLRVAVRAGRSSGRRGSRASAVSARAPSIVALGLVAGAAAAGVSPPVEELLAAGLELEGHGDNLAPALAGGVCLTYDGRDLPHRRRSAGDARSRSIPDTRVNTAASRELAARRRAAESMPSSASCARRSSARRSPRAMRALFAAALDDRLHEPYRIAHAPHLAEIRADLPAGALGATLSGSGPTVIVWVEPSTADSVAASLERRYPRFEVRVLALSSAGAG